MYVGEVEFWMLLLAVKVEFASYHSRKWAILGNDKMVGRLSNSAEKVVYRRQKPFLIPVDHVTVAPIRYYYLLIYKLVLVGWLRDVCVLDSGFVRLSVGFQFRSM